MFSRKNRIDRKTVVSLLGQKKALFSSFFVFKVGQNNLDVARFAVLTPKKNLVGAISRHLLKRRVLAVLKEIHRLSPIKKQDYLIFFNKKGVNPKYEEIKKDILETINNNKLMFFDNL